MPKGFEDVLVVQYQRAKIVQEKKDAYLEFVFDGHPSKFKISKSNVSSQELQTLLEDKLADFCQQIAINQEVAFLEEFTRLYQKGYPIDQLDLAGINTEAYVGFLSVQGFKQELLSSENAEDLYFDYLASLPSQALQLEEVSAELSALVELTLQAKIGYPVEWLAEQAKTLDEAIIAFYLKNFAEFDREKLQDEDASEISGGGKDYKVFCQLLNKLSKTYAAKSSRVPTAWEIEYDGVVSYKLITGDEVESFSTSDELSGEIARQTNNHWLLQTEDQVSYWILHKGWFSSKLASYSLERFVAEVQAKEKQEAASRRRWAIGLGLSTTFAGVQDLFASAFYGRRGVAEDNFDFIGEESVTISSGALALPSGAGYVQRESTSQSNSSQLLSSIVNYKSSVDFLSFPNSFHQLTNYAINSLVPFVAMRKMGLSSSVSLFVSGVFGALKTVSGGVTNTTVTLQFDAPTAAPVRISIENSTMGITFAPSTGMAITDVKDLPYGLSISTPLVSTSIKLISNVQAMNYLSDYLLIGTSGGSISCYNLTTLTVAKSFPVSGAVYEFSQLPGSSILWIAGASGLYAWNISGTPTSVGSYAGNLIGAVAVNNGLVYAADGLSTNLVRIISQTTITQVRSITIPSGTIKQLCALNNNALAVAASTAGVYLYANVDSSPTLAATILVPSAISVGSYGNYLFIVDTSGLFYVVDIASLSAPRIIYFSSGIFSGRTLYVTSDGAMVYVTQANGVVNFYSIVDLPRVTFVGQRSVPDLVLKMAATPTQTLVTLGQGLLGIRKDNYSQRVVKGDLIQAQFNLGTLQTVRSVTVSGTPQQIVKVGANYFVASQGTGLLIYDSNWTLLGSFSATGVKSLAVLPTGNTVIIANGSSGAQIINTTNKASPALISTITPGTRNFQSVAISPTNSNYIALADSSGSVVVYSIATLASPSQVSSTAVAGSNFHAIGFASDGTTVYAAGNGSISGGLNYKGPLVEITNALTATPTLARTSYMPYGGESLAITSDQQYILVAGSVNGGLLVFSRQTLKVVASSLLNTTARGVAVCGTTTSPAGYFFALATDAGTYVFFFDPAAQSLTQVADLNNAAKSLLMDGAQLITGGTGIQAFDLSQQSVSLNPMFNTSVSVYGSDGAQQEEDQPIWIMPTPAYQAPASNQPYQLGIASSISAGQITQGVGVTANISFSDSNAVISVPSYPDVTVIISPGQLTATSNVYGVANLNALLANIQVTSAAASLTASCSFTDQVHTVIQSNVSFSPQHTLFLNANSGFSSVYSGNTNTFANLGSINSPATQATVVISIPAAQMTAANVTVFTTTAASGATVTYQSGSITITGTPSAVNATLANGITLRANNIDFAGALSLNMTAADNINGSGYQVTSATSVSLQALPNTVPAYSGGYSVPNIVAGNSVTINLAALFSSADGRPVTLSVNLSNFPAGMASYNASTGLLTVSTQALIQQAGTYNFAVTATNGNQQLTQTFQANVQPPPYATPVWSSTITTKTKVAGSAESFSLGTVTSSDGRTSTYSLAVLDQSNQPVSGTWYSINSTTGVVSLTSSLPAGSYTLRVTAQNGSASATSDLNLTVMPALTAAVAPSVSLQQAAVGTAFSFTVPAFTSITSGATTTDSFTNLPTGWSYNASTRVLTGTPTKTMSTLALTEAFTVSRTNPETNQLESFTTNLTLNVQVQPSLAMSNFAQTVSGGISTQALSVVNNTLAITTPASNLTAILQVSTSSASLQLTASGAAAVTQPSAGVYQVTGPKADVVNTLKTLKALVNNVDFSGNVAISATIQDGVNNDVTQTITAQFQPLPYATPVWSSTSLTTKTKVAGSAESFSLGTVTSSDGRTSTYSLAVLDQSNQPVSGAWYSINGTTGVVSLTAGLPAGNYTLRVTAQNGNASATSDLNLTVMPALTAAVAPSVSLQQAAVGTAFSFTVPAFTSITSGATTTDGFTNLPTGWSYDASTRVLTGTPTKTMSMLALTEAFTVSRTNPETNQLESFTTNLTLNFQVQPSLAMSNFAQTVSGGISTQALSIINNTLAITTPASNLTAILQANVSASLQLTASGAAVVSQPSAGVCQVTGPKADVIATLKTLKAQVSDVDFAGDVAISATIQDGVNNDVTQTITAQFQPLPYATPVWSNTSLTTKTKVAGSAESFSLGTVTSSDGRTSTYSLVVLDQSNQPVSGAWYSINSTTGVVSLTAGLPAGNYTLRVTAQNGSASTASDLNLTVLPVLAAAIAPSVSLQQAAVGTAFSFTVPAFTSITSGATTTDSFTNLPTGWSYNTSTRVLTGIPTKTMSTLALTEAFTVSRTNPETNQLESFTTNLTLNVQVQPSLAISNFAQTVSGGISTQALSVVNNTLAITTPASNLTAILQISTSSASLQLTASGAAVVTQPSAGVYQVTGPKADVIATLKTLKAQVSNVDFAGDVAISATIQDGVNNDVTQTITAQFQPLPYATPVWSNASLTTKTKVAGSAESFSLGTVTSSDGRTSTYSLVVLDQGSQPVSGTWYSINSTTGVISLTSALPAGNYTLRVTAQNGSASAMSDLSLTVLPVLTAAVAPSVNISQALVGEVYLVIVPAFTNIVSGATVNDSFTNLPTGWSYNASTRVLTGTPTKTMSTLALTEAFTVSRTNPETNQLESFTTNLTLNVQVQPSLAMSNFAQTVSGGVSTQALSVVNNTLAITTPASNLTAILQVSTSSASLQLTASGAAAVSQLSAGMYQVTGPKADVVNTLKALKALVSDVDFAGDVAISAMIQDGMNNDVTQTITAQFQSLPYATPVWSNTSLTTKTKVAGSAESFSLGTITSSDGRTSIYSLAVLDQSNHPVSGVWYSINSTTGAISLTSGLPTGNYTLRVTAQNGNASATSDLNLTVVPALTAAVAPSVSLQQAAVGTSFSFTLPPFTNITSGATTTDSFTNLPAGWSYNASTRVLTGTPTKTMSTLALTEAFTVSRTNPETNQLESFTTNLTLNVQVQPSLAMSNFAQTVSGGISTQALSVVNNTLAITTPASNLTAILQVSTSSASLQLTASGAAVITQSSAGVYQVTGPKADVIATLKTLKAQVSDVDFAGDVAISATIQDGVNNDVTQTITAQFQPLPYATPVWSNTSLTTKTKVAGSAESFSLGTVTSSDGRTSTYSLVVLDQGSQPVSGTWYSINSTTGVISLTSALPAGNYTLRVTAKNGNAFATSDLNLTVVPALTAAVAPSVLAQQASVGEVFSFAVPSFTNIVSGATVNDSFANLPAGWSYDASTRVLTGMPTKVMSTLALTEAFTVSRVNPESNQLESSTTNLTLNVQVQPSLAVNNLAQMVSGGVSTQALSVVNNTLAITTPASNLTVILQVSTSTASLQLIASGAAVISQPSVGIYQVTGSKADVVATLKTLKAQVSDVDFAGDVAISATVQDELNTDITQTITAQFQPLPYVTPVWSNTSLTTKTKVAGSAESFSLGTVTSSDGRESTYSLAVLDQSSQSVPGNWYSINSVTGVISLTLALPKGSYRLVATAHNGDQVAEATLDLTVVPILTAAVAPSISQQQASVGIPYSFTIPEFMDITAGATVVYSMPNLPQGWEFNPDTRELTGTPISDMSALSLEMTATVNRINPETNQIESLTSQASMSVQVTPSLSLGSSQKSFTGVSGTIASCPQSFSIQTPAPQLVVDLHISVEQIQAADIHDFNCTAVGNANVSKQETIHGTSLIITGSLEEVNAILEQGYQLKASNIDYEGDISITVTVRDTLNKEAVSTTTALTLTEYPRATPQWLNTITTKTKIEGNSEVLSLGNATLIDGRQPSYSLRVYRRQTQALMNVAWCTIDSQTGDVSFTTDIPEGDYLIEVTAHNAQVESKTLTSLTVWPNLIPAEAPALEVQEINVGESFEIQLAGFNYHSPGASISYSIENLPSDWVFDAQQLRLRGKPGKEMLHKVPQPQIVAKLSRENPETGDLESFDTATVVPLSVAPSLLVMPIVQNLNGTAGILLSPQPLVISSPASLVNVTLQLSANTSSASLELHASRSTRLTYHLEGSPEVVSEYLSQLKVRIDDIDYEGPLNVALFVDDGINYPLQGNLTAQIQAFPDATPQLVTNTDLSTLVIQAGKAITVPIPSFTVADGRPITYEVTLLKDGVVINPAWFSVDYAQGLIHFAPDAGLSGSLSIRTIARNRSKQSECSRGSFVFNLSYFLAGLAAFATAGGCLTGIFYLLCRKKKLKPIDEWGVKLKAGEERFIALDKVLLVEKNILETGKAEDRKSVFMLDTPSHLPDKVKITFNGNIIHIDTKGSIQAIGDYAINLTEYSPSGEYRFSYPLPITVTEPDFAQPVWSDVQCQLRDLVIRAGETWSANIGIASCADDRGLTYDYHVASTAEKQAAINFDPLSGDFMLAVPEKRGYEGEYEITVRAVNAQNDRFYAERKIFILVRPAIFSRPVWTTEALAAQVLQAGNRCTLYVGKASASDERPLKYKIVTNPSLKEGTFITEYNADTGEIGISAKGTIDQQANYEVTVYAINGDVWEPKSFPLVVTEPAFARPEWQADADALLPAKNHKIESNASVFDLRYFVAACGREVEVDCQFLPGPCVSYERTMKRLVISPAKTVEEAGEYRVKIIAKNGPEVVVYEVSFAVIVPPPEKPVFIGTSFYEIVAGENLDIHLPATIFQTRDGRKPSLMIDFSAAAKKLSIVKDDEFIHVNTKAIKQQAGRYAIYVMAINEGVETIQNITVLVQKPPYAKPELEDKHALLSQEVVVHGKEKMLTIPRFFVSDGRQKELRYEIKLLLASTRIEVQPDWFEFDRKTGQIKLLPHATHEKFIIQIEARNGNASTVVEYGLQISRPMHPHVATQMEYPAFNDSPYMTEAVELRREYEGAFGDRIPLPGLSPRFQEHSRQEMDKTEELMLLHGKSSRLSSRVSSRAQRRALPLLRKLESRLLPPEQLFSVTPGAADTSHTPTLFQNEEEDLLQGLYVPFEEAAGVAPPVQSQPGHSPSLLGLRNSLPSSDSSPRSLPPGLSPVGSPTTTFFSRRPIERDRLPPLQLQSLPPVAALRPSDSLFKKVDEPSNAPVQTLSLQDREVRDAWENLKVLSEKARLLMRQLNIG